MLERKSKTFVFIALIALAVLAVGYFSLVPTGKILGTASTDGGEVKTGTTETIKSETPETIIPGETSKIQKPTFTTEEGDIVIAGTGGWNFSCPSRGAVPATCIRGQVNMTNGTKAGPETNVTIYVSSSVGCGGGRLGAFHNNTTVDDSSVAVPVRGKGFFSVPDDNCLCSGDTVVVTANNGTNTGTNTTTVPASCPSQTDTTNVKVNLSSLIPVADASSPIVRLESPVNSTYANYTSITFKCNLTDDVQIANVSLIVWNSLGSVVFYNNTTLTGTTNNTSWTNTLSSDGNYTWNCKGTDNSSNSAFSIDGNFTLVVDTVVPSVNSIAPSGTHYNQYNNVSFVINVTDGSGVSTVLANVSIPGDGFEIVPLIFNGTHYVLNYTDTVATGRYNFTILTNDSAGNVNNTQTGYFYIDDVVAPKYMSNFDNSSGGVETGSLVGTYVFWNDTVQLHTGILRTNLSGTWVNMTPVCSFSTAAEWCNRTIDTTSYVGYVCWNEYANDTSGNMNNSMPVTDHCFTITPVNQVPTTTLIKPNNGNITSSNVINFSCNATDEGQVDNITLYWNYSGSWAADTTTATSGTAATVYFEKSGLNDGSIKWNCRSCDNVSACAFASSNWTVTKDTVNPTWSSVTNNPSSPVTFTPGGSYQFNITWTDSMTNVNDVIFEFNGMNYSHLNSQIIQNGNVYSITLTGLSANPSGYSYTWYANDSAGNWNATTLASYVINQGTISMTLVLNGSASDFFGTYPASTVNATGTASTGTINIYRNGLLLSSGGSPKTDITMLANGTYVYFVNATGNTNYSDNSVGVTRTAYINKAASTCSLSFSPSSTTTYGTPMTPSCSCTNPEGAAVLYRNGAVVTGESGVVLGASTYTYVCNVSATQNYSAASNTSSFVVNQANPSSNLLLYLNGSQSDLSAQYGQLTNATGIATLADNQNLVFNLYRNGSSVASGDPATELNSLAYGYYVYIYNTTGNTNYTAGSSPARYLTVTKISDFVNLSLNGTQSDITLAYGQQVNASSVSTSGTDSIFRNDSNVDSEKNIYKTLAAGYYRYKANTTGDTNYNANSTGVTRFVLINKAARSCTLNILPGSTITYGTQTNASCSCTNIEDGTVKLYRNGSDVTATENNQFVTLGAEYYSYICNISATQNYTTASATGTQTVNKGTISMTLVLNGSASDFFGTYPASTVNATATASAGTINMYINGVLLTSGTSPRTNVTLLGNGTYTYFVNATGNANYSSNSTGVTRTAYINKATSTCSLSFIPGTTITYGTLLNASCSCNNPEVAYNLYRNGSLINGENGADVTLGAEGYLYVCNVSATQNYTADSKSQTITVNKATSSTYLYLNNSRANRDYPQGSLANFTVVSNVPAGATVELATNISGWVTESGTSPLVSLPILNTNGYYNITGYFPGNTNYTSSSETWFANVSDTIPPTLYVVSPLNNTVVTENNVIANVSLSEDGSVCYSQYENNGTNLTMTPVNSTYYSINIGGLTSGEREIEFWCNDTSNNWGYNITQFNVTIVLGLNVTYPEGLFELAGIYGHPVSLDTPNFTVLNVNGELGDNLTCTIVKSDGSEINLTKTFASTATENVTFNYTLSSSDVSGAYERSWYIKNCTLQDNVSLPKAQNVTTYPVYVKTDDWYFNASGTLKSNDAANAYIAGTAGTRTYFGHNDAGDSDIGFAVRKYANVTNFEGICNDGIDNDGDGAIDCADPDCQVVFFPGCGHTTIRSGLGEFSLPSTMQLPAVNCSGNICSTTIGGAAISYTQSTSPTGQFKVRVERSVGSPEIVFITLKNATTTAFTVSNSTTTIYGPSQPGYKWLSPDTGTQYVLIASSKANASDTRTYSGNLDFVMNTSLPSPSPINYTMNLDVFVGSGQGNADFTMYVDGSSPMNMNENDSSLQHVTTHYILGTQTTSDQACNDGVDNDLNYDGTDCGDRDCNNSQIGVTLKGDAIKCEYANETTCWDGFDNDHDGLVDCADPDCAGQIGAYVNVTTGQPVKYYIAGAPVVRCESSEGNTYYGSTPSSCNDKFDNDGETGNGYINYSCSTNASCEARKIDCYDAYSCWGRSGTTTGICPLRESACSDHIDNDYDKLIAGTSSNWQSMFIPKSNVDNTGADCDDYDCHGASNCPLSENKDASGNSAPAQCFDGKDNDLDAYYWNGSNYVINTSTGIDCADPDCSGVTYNGKTCTLTELDNTTYNYCNDSFDNDVDSANVNGGLDCHDRNGTTNNSYGTTQTDCWAAFGYCGPCPTFENNTWKSCADGVNNDLDNGFGLYGTGGTDCADSDCNGEIGSTTNAQKCELSVEATCNDSFDNNGNGATDCADASCAGKTGAKGQVCGSENTATLCNDNYDNDGNGLIDCIDPSCFGVGVCSAKSWTTGSCVTVPASTGATSIGPASDLTMDYTFRQYYYPAGNFSITFRNQSSLEGQSVYIVIGHSTAKIPFNITSSDIVLSGTSAGSFSKTFSDGVLLLENNTPISTLDLTVTMPANVTTVPTTNDLYSFPILTQSASGQGNANINTNIYENTMPSVSKIEIEPNGTDWPIDYGSSVSFRAIPVSHASGICRCNFDINGAEYQSADDQCIVTLSNVRDNTTFTVSANSTDGSGMTGNTYGPNSSSVSILPIQTSMSDVTKFVKSNFTSVTVNAAFVTELSSTWQSTCYVTISNSTDTLYSSSFTATPSGNTLTCSSSVAVPNGTLPMDGMYYVTINATDSNLNSIVSDKKVFYLCDNLSSEGTGWSCKRADFDGDGVTDGYSSEFFSTRVCDNCPGLANANQTDSDWDGVGDACDNCPTVKNTNQDPAACATEGGGGGGGGGGGAGGGGGGGGGGAYLNINATVRDSFASGEIPTIYYTIDNGFNQIFDLTVATTVKGPNGDVYRTAETSMRVDKVTAINGPIELPPAVSCSDGAGVYYATVIFTDNTGKQRAHLELTFKLDDCPEAKITLITSDKSSYIIGQDANFTINVKNTGNFDFKGSDGMTLVAEIIDPANPSTVLYSKSFEFDALSLEEESFNFGLNTSTLGASKLEVRAKLSASGNMLDSATYSFTVLSLLVAQAMPVVWVAAAATGIGALAVWRLASPIKVSRLGGKAMHLRRISDNKVVFDIKNRGIFNYENIRLELKAHPKELRQAGGAKTEKEAKEVVYRWRMALDRGEHKEIMVELTNKMQKIHNIKVKGFNIKHKSAGHRGFEHVKLGGKHRR